ncbi:ABC transporter permease [Chelatococcus sp. SYSU_G07232]|uniref:ABC transporter permease n=1 Tax=Chelatococcus albus TaxID=3047466 RepID=A0ABT7AHV7_9HYPH|nr:ABC transporter permease [Chelatococcus sp. SYSU_G07232]MDJ1158943.1 ABC transporter permease [Chelatococcus sp. SYSU_G07232]
MPFTTGEKAESPAEAASAPAPAEGAPGLVARLKDNDLVASFLASKMTMVAAVVTVVLVAAALFAPWIAPTDPFDPAKVDLLDSHLPPRWVEGGEARFLLGTDDQGRDLFSAVLYGLRVSLLIGALGVAFAAAIGITLGLVAGYVGGRVDAVIMRIADVQLTFPAILIALLVDGVVHALLKGASREDTAFGVLVLSIGLSFWVQYARTIRGSTLVEKNKDYIQAARLVGLSPVLIMMRHVLPNVVGPVLVILTINLGLAVITEATLSFLGVGLPPTQPSLGTLIRIGQQFLFSGEWWIVAFPGVTLAGLVLAVNLLGDWLRDALNPKLR